MTSSPRMNTMGPGAPSEFHLFYVELFLAWPVLCYVHRREREQQVFVVVVVFNFYCYSITVVCLPSPSLHPTPAEPTSLPHLHPPPIPSMCPSQQLLQSPPPTVPTPLPPGHCQTVPNFNVSGYILFAFFFC